MNDHTQDDHTPSDTTPGDRAADDRTRLPAAELQPPPVLPRATSSARASIVPPPPARRGRKLPLAIGLVVLVAILLGAGGLLLYRYYTHDSGQTTVTGGVLTATPSGLYFRNAAENLAFVAPADWSRYPTTSAQIMVRGGGCSFGLLEQRTRLPIPAFADAEAKDLKRRHPDASPIIAPRTVAGKNGLAFTGAYTDSEGGPMSQTYILIDRGPNVITLIETATDPTCAQAFANLEDSLHL